MQPLSLSSLVDIRTATCTDTNKLFDYESKKYKHNHFVCSSNSKILINTSNTDLIALSTQQLHNLPPKDLEPLISIIKVCSQGVQQYFIDVERNENKVSFEEALGIDTSPNDIYLSVKSLRNQKRESRGYKLQFGDIVKFGRIKFIVSELVVDGDVIGKAKPRIGRQVENKFYVVKDENSICKACNKSNSPNQNLLIALSECKGICSSIHVSCYKKIIKEKVKMTESEGLVSYDLNGLFCQQGKHDFPLQINIQNQQIFLFSIKYPQTNTYVVLQTYQQNRNKGIYLISKQKQPIKIGRQAPYKLLLSDISISRKHAKIQYESDGFYLYDKDSKFGTGIKVRSSWKITNSKVAFLIGKHAISFRLKNKNSKSKTKSKEKPQEQTVRNLLLNQSFD